jgi:tRNA modification GTPase
MISHQQQDTITALSTVPGPGARAVVRLSGPEAFRTVAGRFTPALPRVVSSKTLLEGNLDLQGVAHPLPATLLLWPGPRTYTGQDLVEIHTLSCPPLVELLISQLLQAGTRVALPGEFTLRAFLAGKLDLTRAEAVLGIIEAGSADELRQALRQLAGGVATPLHALRDDLLNLLADVEAALDFADEDIEFVSSDELLRRLGQALAHLTNLSRQLDQRNLASRPFRAVLVGHPNAGKSSLFNALAGHQDRSPALVSPQPGTTRDYLIRHLTLGKEGLTIALVDTAGWQPGEGSIEEQAQKLGRSQSEEADVLLLCVPAGESSQPEELALLANRKIPVIPLASKCDQVASPPEDGWLATSARTGAGLEELKKVLAERASQRSQSALAPSWSRCRHHVESCLEHLRRAHSMVVFEEPPELLALELREGLQQLGEMVGAVYSDDLLDRIFSRFCVGK